MAVGSAALAGTFRQSATKKQLGRCQLGNAGAELRSAAESLAQSSGAVERLSGAAQSYLESDIIQDGSRKQAQTDNANMLRRRSQVKTTMESNVWAKEKS